MDSLVYLLREMSLFYVMRGTENYICKFNIFYVSYWIWLKNAWHGHVLTFSYKNENCIKIRTNSCDAVNCLINSVNAGKSWGHARVTQNTVLIYCGLNLPYFLCIFFFISSVNISIPCKLVLPRIYMHIICKRKEGFVERNRYKISLQYQSQ